MYRPNAIATKDQKQLKYFHDDQLHTLALTITNTYKQYDKKPTAVAVTRPLRTSIGPSLNTA